ncbi:hypothetical protein AAE02nite_01970 [Adhaeribacter aerolatus]|uniref:Lipoprotein n=1 Tax=Adhaeribacter aerolatus TaxID=670289 RepID=A0A512AS39_9BACT|nr:hypothetical protein [Adhaeribacter aerolatus]GEO02533.1 hypothetical protein AAE02nite_01970 [Adhaeribacter aerolatus]
MKLTLFTSLLLFAVCLFSGCDQSDDVTPEPTVFVNTFNGKIFGEPTVYASGKDNFQARSGLWQGGGESFAEIGLETPSQTAGDLQLVVNSKIIASPLTSERSKELFAVGAKSGEGNFAGFHVVFRRNGQTYSTVGGDQPVNFLEVTKLEELPTDPRYQEFNFKVVFKINGNLYQYGAPHGYAGKIENGELVAYYLR